jgi:hypothetical protein
MMSKFTLSCSHIKLGLRYTSLIIVIAVIYSEVTDYSFSSPADSWPSSFEDDAVMTNVSKSFVGVPRASKLAATKTRLPRPIRTLRKIAGWVFRSPEGRNARGFGTNTLL